MKPIRHGELVLLPIKQKSLKGAVCKTNYIVSHSETGHHHIIDGDCMVLEREGRDTLLELKKPTTIKHKKSHDKHDDLPVGKGIFRVLKKKEYDPFAKVMREVFD